MSDIKRLSYRLAEVIWGSELCQLIVAKTGVESFWLSEKLPLGIPVDIAYFIVMECRCVHCKSEIGKDLPACPCGKTSNAKWHLEVEFPTDEYNIKFRKLFRREQKRVAALKRKERMAHNGGLVSKSELDELLRIQEGLCFFCGCSVLDEQGEKNFHADHYVPLCKGGENSIFNIVLTCPSCNLRKSEQLGDDFEMIARNIRSPEVGRKLGYIRRRRNTYLNQLAAT